jgi:alpha-L-arabinofuranosidase
VPTYATEGEEAVPVLEATAADQPERVLPRSVTSARVEAGALHADLPPRSWNLLRL